ncbi:MAG: mandelate racemase/muconate lactonizing enzyme family protein [Alphaproteobacteria bacterium]
MKIARVDTHWVAVPFDHRGPANTGFGGRTWADMQTLIVEIETDSGIIGYGEIFGHNAIPSARMALDTMIKPFLIGRDARAIGPLMLELQKQNHNFGRYGQSMFAISGVDTALWDIAGKAAGLPLWQLLGGTSTDKLPAYASFMRYGDLDTIEARSAEAVAEGYGYIKLHERTPEAVAACRAGGGPDLRIMVDTNCPWTPAEAIEIGDEMAASGVHWLEEPVWPPENFEGLAEVRANGLCPIAAGENASTSWEFKQMFQAGAVDWAQPSIAKVGGVTEARKISILAEAANVGLAPHSPYFGPGFVATMHVVAAHTGAKAPIERLYGDMEVSLYGDLVNPGPDGCYTLPSGPGLGVEPDPNVIRDFRKNED